MTETQSDKAPKYERLLAEKADRLADLMKCKPGEKRYKQSLKAFLEADAKAQKALMKRIEDRSSRLSHDRETRLP